MDIFAVEAIECKKEENGKWTCDILRKFTEPKRINDEVCYRLKREKISNIDDVHLKEGKDMKCGIHDDGISNFIICEGK